MGYMQVGPCEHRTIRVELAQPASVTVRDGVAIGFDLGGGETTVRSAQCLDCRAHSAGVELLNPTNDDLFREGPTPRTQMLQAVVVALTQWDGSPRVGAALGARPAQPSGHAPAEASCGQQEAPPF